MRPRVEDLARSLQRCILQKDAAEALRLHACIQEHGLDAHPSLGNPLVVALAQSGNIALAQQAFNGLASPDASSFNSLITGYAKHGEPRHALSLYQQLQASTSLYPSIHTYVALLKSCSHLRNLDQGREIHSDIIRHREALDTNMFIGSALVDMYAKCGCLFKAQEVFDMLMEKNIVAWTALISGYVDNGHAEEALYCFEQMQHERVPVDAVTYVCILKACASICHIQKGQVIHAGIIRKGLERDVVIGSTLVIIYAKHGLLTTARDVFNKLPNRDVVLWSSLIVGYAEKGLGEEALDCYKLMQCEGLNPDNVIFVCILKACSSIGAAQEGQEIHAEITTKGFESDPFIFNTLIDLYVKCGLRGDAQGVLDRNLFRTVVSWNALLAGYADCGHGKEVLDLFDRMQCESVAPDSVTFICSLKACGSMGTICKGYEMHSEVAKKGLDAEIGIGSALVDMYAKCGELANAQETFDKLNVRDVVSWNALITGYVDHGHGYETLDCIESMRQEGFCLQAVTYVCGLKACGNIRDIHKGLELHADAIKKGLESSMLVGSSLVDMYVKCSSLTNAEEVFQKLPDKDVVLWNTLLVGFVDHEHDVDARNHFEQMQCEGVCPDDVSLVCSLKFCGSLGIMDKGYKVHAELVERGWEGDIFVGNTLVDMYTNCGTLLEAQNVFDKLTNRSVVSWNALIVGYAEQGQGFDALKCFDQMQDGGVLFDNVTLVCVLKACGATGSILKGRSIHSAVMRKGLDTDMLVSNTLVDMYYKCGSAADAEHTFDKLLSRSVSSWNALIVGSMESGSGEEAISFFEQMQCEGMSPDEVTFICCLRACGSEGAVVKGQDLHTKIINRGFENDDFIGNTLVDMYVKCGFLEEAQHIQDNVLLVQTVYSWNAIITGYSQLGESKKLFWAFDKMIGEGINPNAITFVSILNSCNHSGIVDKCHLYFETMSRDFGIVPTLQHLTCIIDLLGRAGNIDKAVSVIKRMPFHPGLVVWHTVLGACRKWGDLEFGRHAFENAVQLNEKNATAYIFMSNIYAETHMQDDWDQFQHIEDT